MRFTIRDLSTIRAGGGPGGGGVKMFHDGNTNYGPPSNVWFLLWPPPIALLYCSMEMHIWGWTSPCEPSKYFYGRMLFLKIYVPPRITTGHCLRLDVWDWSGLRRTERGVCIWENDVCRMSRLCWTVNKTSWYITDSHILIWTYTVCIQIGRWSQHWPWKVTKHWPWEVTQHWPWKHWPWEVTQLWPWKLTKHLPWEVTQHWT